MIEAIKMIKKSRTTRNIEFFFRGNKLGWSQLGLITVALSPVEHLGKGKHIFSIEHLGNSSHTIKNVNIELKKHGFLSIDEYKEMYEVIQERGSPLSYYSIEFDFNNNQSKIN